MVSDHLHSISQMVRTRATTAPTPTLARQDASEPATEAVARRGAVARGMVEVTGGRPLEEEDKHLAQPALGR